MGLIAPISAIYSWEGYKYQGNITLYVTLSYIKDILSKQETLDDYEVQIEGEEDFALLKNGQYKSLHQVKLGAVNLDDKKNLLLSLKLFKMTQKWVIFMLIQISIFQVTF